MRTKILIAGLLCLLITSACVITEAVKIGTTPRRPPIPQNQVIVYRTADQVPGKYEEIALLSSTGDSMWTSEKMMWESMKKKAGMLGANAIILDAMSEPSDDAKLVGLILGIHGAERKGKAIAIYVFPKEEKKEDIKK